MRSLPGCLVRSEAQELLDELNAAFEMSIRMQFTNCSAGRYFPARKTMRIGSREWRGFYGVVHEFAHALYHHRVIQDSLLPRSERRPTDRGHHGRVFYGCLKDVIRVWKRDLRLYSWHTEYKTIWKWAVKEGLTVMEFRTAGKPGVASHLTPELYQLVGV